MSFTDFSSYLFLVIKVITARTYLDFRIGGSVIHPLTPGWLDCLIRNSFGIRTTAEVLPGIVISQLKVPFSFFQALLISP